MNYQAILRLKFILQKCQINVYIQNPLCFQGVGECVGILKKYPDTTWKGVRAMMGDQKFLKSLLEFDKDSLGDKQALSRPHFPIFMKPETYSTGQPSCKIYERS